MIRPATAAKYNQILKLVQNGSSIEQACNKNGMAVSSFYTYKSKFKNMPIPSKNSNKNNENIHDAEDNNNNERIKLTSFPEENTDYAQLKQKYIQMADENHKLRNLLVDFILNSSFFDSIK